MSKYGQLTDFRVLKLHLPEDFIIYMYILIVFAFLKLLLLVSFQDGIIVIVLTYKVKLSSC